MKLSYSNIEKVIGLWLCLLFSTIAVAQFDFDKASDDTNWLELEDISELDIEEEEEMVTDRQLTLLLFFSYHQSEPYSHNLCHVKLHKFCVKHTIIPSNKLYLLLEAIRIPDSLV